MRPRRPLPVCAVLVLAAGLLLRPAVAAETGGDSVSVDREAAAVGEPFVLIVEVRAPATATIDFDPTAESWNGVEILEVTDRSFEAASGTGIHRIEMLAAGFVPDSRAFSAVVLVTDGGTVERREFPMVSLHVVPTLPEGAASDLSPLTGLEATGGGQSPLLVPALVGAAAVGVVVVLVLGRLGLRLAVRIWRSRRRRWEPIGAPPPWTAIDVARRLLSSDVAEAYRLIGQAVRAEVSRRFELPAPALTTGEIGDRLAAAGADRWQSRLVSGLLEECDSVVYAGYRPAPQRVDADLAMALEILGEAG